MRIAQNVVIGYIEGYLPRLIITLRHIWQHLSFTDYYERPFTHPVPRWKAVVVIVDVNMVAGLNTGASNNSCDNMEGLPATTLRPVRGQRFNSGYTRKSIYKLIWVRKHDDVISRDSHYSPEAL